MSNAELKDLGEDSAQDNSVSPRVLRITHFERVNDFETGFLMKDGTAVLSRSNHRCSERFQNRLPATVLLEEMKVLKSH